MITINKTADYQYTITADAETELYISTFDEYLSEEDTDMILLESGESQRIETTNYTDNTCDVLIIKTITDSVDDYYVLFETTRLAEVVIDIMRVLCCIQTEEECNGVTHKDEEDARMYMTSIMTLFFSILFKINQVSPMYNSIGSKTLELLNDANREIKMINVMLDDYE